MQQSNKKKMKIKRLKIPQVLKPIILIEVFLLIPFCIIWYLGVNNYDIAAIVFSFAYIISLVNILYIADGLFNFIIGIFGLQPTRLNKDIGGNLIIPFPKKVYHFVLIICAHNEAPVITNTLEETLKLDYPKERLKIVVVCDNCTDNTAQNAKLVAQKHSDQIFVLERANLVEKGKPFAVKYAFDWIDLNIPEYEAISIADADNIYHRDFFRVMNWKLNSGAEIIQGYLGVKNQYDSYVSTASTLSYFASALVYWSSRQNLGMSGTIGGTGFVLTRNILKVIGWDMGTLTEDLEFSTKCVLLGHKIDYAYDAITYDEKPTQLSVSYNQRKRWMQGHNDVMKKYLLSLIFALYSFGKTNKLSLFDYIMYVSRPIKKVLYLYFFTAMGLIYITNYLGFYYIPMSQINTSFTLATIVLMLALEYGSAILEGFKWWKIVEIVYYYTVFNVNDYLATFAGIFLASPKGVWVKTEHKVTVSIEKVMSN
jgi:cellulose synthase/poly-beta-1,6-N-acetylglucosamine synthase-like glycosyltransferase